MSKLSEESELLAKRIKDLEQNVQGMKKLKPAEKKEFAIKYDKQCKRAKIILQSYQFSIQDSSDDPDIANHKAQYKQYKNRIQKIQNAIQFNRTAGVSQEELFKHRNPAEKDNLKQQRGQYIQKGRRVQQQGIQALTRANRNVIVMDDLSKNINIQLNRQIQQLDNMYDNLKDTETTFKRLLIHLFRAQRHIKYFARQMYTDKITMCLIVIIIIAIVVIIILSAIGKTPKAQIDILK